MSSYLIVPGDTFALIAKKVYGSETQAGRIENANPAAKEPLTPGTTLFIPADLQLPEVLPAFTAEDQDEVGLVISNERFRFWKDFALRRSLDGVAQVSFGAPFEPDNEIFKRTFELGKFQPVTVTIGSEAMFAGNIVNIVPGVSENERRVNIGAYAKCGVLNDCTAPSTFTAQSLQFLDQPLERIATRLADPFGIKVKTDASTGDKFLRAGLDPASKILPFLTSLAKQRNVVLSSNAQGDLRILQSVASGEPIQVLAEGTPPVVSVTPRFNFQAYYSIITGLGPTSLSANGASFTKRNDFAAALFRPFMFKSEDSTPGNLKASTEAKIGRMLANAASYQLTVNTWRDSAGRLWEPNTLLQLQAPGAMIYNPYKFLVREVVLSATENRRVATLDLVMPGAFSGEIPEVLPWAL